MPELSQSPGDVLGEVLGSRVFVRIRAAWQFLWDYGFGELLRVIVYRKITRHLLPLLRPWAAVRLQRALADKLNHVIVMVGTLDWNYRYRQRQHHIAIAMARLGHTIVYVTPGHGHDREWILSQRRPGIFVTPHLEPALALQERPMAYVLSTDVKHLENIYQSIRQKSGHLIYDYLDHLDTSISNAPVDDAFRRIHHHVLSDAKRCTVLATADALATEVASVRSTQYALVTNGVDTDHFDVARDDANLRSDLRKIVARGKPIVGFFGALASWVDFDLVTNVARRRPDIEVVMMGPQSDIDLPHAASRPQNLNIVDAVSYQHLPAQAACFDVQIVPFKLNSITRATSPLKLFEYMALGKPIVSTPIPEAQKYPCVLIARDGAEFAARIDDALSATTNQEYQAALAASALANSWNSKARAIMDLIGILPETVIEGSDELSAPEGHRQFAYGMSR